MDVHELTETLAKPASVVQLTAAIEAGECSPAYLDIHDGKRFAVTLGDEGSNLFVYFRGTRAEIANLGRALMTIADGVSR